MRRAVKLVVGSVAVVLVVLGLFLLPVVPISVPYECNGNASECAQVSISTFASATYAALHVGGVYVRDNNDGSFSRYCWMQGNPVTDPAVVDGMCGYGVL